MREIKYDESGLKVVYPNDTCFTRGRYSYIEAVGPGLSGKIAILTMKWSGKEVSISKRLDLRGKAIFRISSILDSWADSDDVDALDYVEFSVVIYNTVFEGALTAVVVGHYDNEIENPFRSTPSNKPYARKIVVYPDLGEDQYIFIPRGGGYEMEITTEHGYALYAGDWETPLFSFNPSDFNEWRSDRYITVSQNFPNAPSVSFRQKIDLDYCKGGLFVKWIDKHGIPYLYRWSVESEADEVETNASFSKLDKQLNPYEVGTKTLTRRWVLHSRAVDYDLFDLCKSILSGHAIEYYDSEFKEWRRAMIAEGEIANSGSILNDVVVEMTDKTYNL